MTFKAALDRIKTWTVSGVTTNYGADGLSANPGQANLPALWVPGLLQGVPFEQPFDIQASSADVGISIAHVLILSGAALKTPAQQFYSSADLIDAYIAKVKTDWTLNDNLAEPLKILGAEFKAIPIGGMSYWVVVFRHKWVLVV